MKLQKQAFTLVEIIVAITVFLIGVSGIYAIIQSTMHANGYNRDYIIATNLAREQIELVRNIRDTNFAKIQAYNLLQPNSENYTDVFLPLGVTKQYYKISNDFNTSTTQLVKIEPGNIIVDSEKIQDMGEYKVCRFENDDMHIYDYCDYQTLLYKRGDGYKKKETNFYKYIQIEAIEDKNGDVVATKDTTDTIIGYPAFKVTSKVVWKNRTVHSFDIQAIFTDYKIF